jgi:hypothetical protein
MFPQHPASKDDFDMSYDWVANLALFGTTIGLTIIARFIAFKIPAIQEMRELNNEAERERMSVQRFRPEGAT